MSYPFKNNSVRTIKIQNYVLNSISEPRSILRQLPLLQLLLLSRCRAARFQGDLVSARVLTAEIDGHEGGEEKCHANEADEDGVAGDESVLGVMLVDASSTCRWKNGEWGEERRGGSLPRTIFCEIDV